MTSGQFPGGRSGAASAGTIGARPFRRSPHIALGETARLDDSESTARAAGGVLRTSKHIVVLGSFARSLVNFRGPLLRVMVERGHRVTACAPAAPAAIIKALQAMGVAYRDVPLEGQGLRPWRDAEALRVLVTLFRELQPDVVLGYTIKPVVYGSIAARLTGVPASYSMITGLGYAFAGEGLKRRLLRRAARWLYRLSLAGNHRVFFQNPDDKALFERLRLLRAPAQAIVINGSGVDLDHFAPVALPERPSFLLIARLLKEKGIQEYVEAARRLKALDPSLVFRLVGPFDGNPAALQARDIERWVQEGVIEYLGALDDVRPAIAATAVYVLPSYYREGTPRTVLEAMAMGRPIVTTDAPGCRETVRDGVNGYLVPVRDPEALTVALERFIDNPRLIPVMGQESHRIAVEKYDVHKVNAVVLQAMGLN